jgi:hypothetical protein
VGSSSFCPASCKKLGRGSQSWPDGFVSKNLLLCEFGNYTSSQSPETFLVVVIFSSPSTTCVCVCVFLLTFSLKPYRQISKPLSFSLQQVRTTHRRALQSAPLETALWLDCSVIHVFSPFLLDHLFFFCRLFCRVIFLLVFLLALSFFVSYCCVDSLCFALLLGSRSSSLRWALTPILLLCVCVFA